MHACMRACAACLVRRLTCGCKVQYMPDGNFRDYLRERRSNGVDPPTVTALQMLTILRDVAAGMDYVASKRCV